MPKINNLIYTAGERLHEVRDYLQLDQSQFASLIGVSLSQYGKMERGDRPVNPSCLKPLEEKGINLEYIETGKGMLKIGPRIDLIAEAFNGLTESQKRTVMAVIESMKRENLNETN